MRSYLEKTWLVFMVAMALGLLYPGFARFLEPYLLYLLMLMVTVSISSIRLTHIFSKESLKTSALLFAANYLLLSSVILILSFLLIKDKDYLSGFIIMAAVPCAIAVVPFTKLLHAEVRLAAAGLVVNYLASLLITPLLIWLFFRQSADMSELLRTLLLLVLVPMAVGYILRKRNISFAGIDTMLINLIFLFTSYGFIGLNRDIIVDNFLSLWPVMLLLFLRTGVLMAIVYLSVRKMRHSIPLTVFSGYKNLGYGALLSLALVSREAALPSTFGILFEMVSFLIFQKILFSASNQKHA